MDRETQKYVDIYRTNPQKHNFMFTRSVALIILCTKDGSENCFSSASMPCFSMMMALALIDLLLLGKELRLPLKEQG